MRLCSFLFAPLIKKGEVWLLENFSQYFKALEFLESWDVKAVELHHDVNDTISLRM